MSTDTLTKPTNPKDAAAVNKLPLNTVPASLKVFAALAFVEGEAKYGGHNWRAAGVLASVYKAAMERHMESWWNGEDNDPRTGTPHLASVIACAGIILDAELAGKLKDDRPPSVDYASLMASLEPKVAAIRDQFAGRNPKHFTEAGQRQDAIDQSWADAAVSAPAPKADLEIVPTGPLQIEAGKFYVDGHGANVGPMANDHLGGRFCWKADSNGGPDGKEFGRRFASDGTSYSADRDPKRSIVAEWSET